MSPLQGKLAQLLPVDMQSQEYHSGCTPIKLRCTVTVHHVQSLRIMSETWVKLKCPAPQLAAIEQVFLAVLFLSFNISYFSGSSDLVAGWNSISFNFFNTGKTFAILLVPLLNCGIIYNTSLVFHFHFLSRLQYVKCEVCVWCGPE